MRQVNDVQDLRRIPQSGDFQAKGVVHWHTHAYKQLGVEKRLILKPFSGWAGECVLITTFFCVVACLTGRIGFYFLYSPLSTLTAFPYVFFNLFVCLYNSKLL